MEKRKLVSLLLTAVLITGMFPNGVSASEIDIVSPWDAEENTQIVEEELSSNELATMEDVVVGQGVSTNEYEPYEEIGSAVQFRGTTIIPELLTTPSNNIGEEAVGGSLMKSGLLSVDKLTQKEIAAEREKLVTTTNRFDTTPSTTNPYSLGKLSDNYLQSGLTYVNYIRTMAGLGTLELNRNLCTNAQYGAVVMAANGVLSHSPSKPSDMSNNFYLPGSAACGTSNIYCSYGYAADSTLKRSVDSYMRDNGSASNLKAMGHRRWILYPSNVRTGFGQADSAQGKNYAVMKVMRNGDYDAEADDPYSNQAVNYNFISWPSSGNFPSETLQKTVPWSVTLNPSTYAKPNINNVKVVLTRVSSLNGKSWTFTKADSIASPNSSTKYLSVNNEGYGVDNCIIFHPGSALDVAQYVGIYQVDITGITKKDGTATAISFQTNFFDVNHPSEDEKKEEDPGYDPNPKDDKIIGDDPNLYSVVFHPENGKDDIVIKDVKANATVEVPQTPDMPVSGNCIFMGWYTEKNGAGTVFDENVQINRNYEVYACWKSEETQSARIEVNGLRISPIATQSYTGSAIRPEFTVKHGSKTLAENEDYRVSYRNNIKAGTATITIYGQGSYTGSKNEEFTISKTNISKADIWLEDQIANGKKLIPKVHARDAAGELVANEDYRISAISGSLTNSGKVTVTILGMGDNYKGSVKRSFLICDESDSLIGDSEITFDKSNESSYDIDSNGAFLYTGYSIKPKIEIIDGNGNVLSSKYYKITYKNNKNAGTASMIITGRKGYRGSCKKYFVIAKRDISSAVIARIPEKTYTGSAIRPKPSVVINVLSAARNKTRKLKIKTDYKVSYTHNLQANSTEVMASTITLTGNKNFTGQIQRNFSIIPKDLAKGITVKGLKTKTYNGEPVIPELTLYYKKMLMKEGADYEVVIENNEAPGRATVIISSGPNGNFKGTLTKYFKIK